MSLGIGVGERIETGGITATEFLEGYTIEHAHSYIPAGLRFVEKHDGTMVLEQRYICTTCGEELWQAVPVVDEGEA
jgi:transposase-like protein